MRSLIVATAFVVSVGAAHGQFFTGNKLHELCSENPTFVSGYVAGLVDLDVMIATGVDADGSPLPHTDAFCIPASVGISVDQVRDISCQYLDDHPEKRHWLGSPIVINSLVEAFPCK